MIDNGYIKLHRKLLSWEWYDDINTKVLFLHLLLKANHSEGKWRGNKIGIGETLTGVNSLSSETGLSIQKIRTALKKLKSTNEITIKATKNFSIIKLNNWNDYQGSNTQDNKRATDEQQTSNIQVTTNKKKENNNKNKEENKNKYGEFKNILLTKKEYEGLKEKYGEDGRIRVIKNLDEGIELKGYKYKNHNLAIQKWESKNSKKSSDGKFESVNHETLEKQREGL